jgi:hypothetical protein
MVMIMPMIAMMMVEPTGNGRPRHIAHGSASDGACGSADNGAGACAHQSFIDPLPGCRGASGEGHSNKERQNIKRICHCVIPPSMMKNKI